MESDNTLGKRISVKNNLDMQSVIVDRSLLYFIIAFSFIEKLNLAIYRHIRRNKKKLFGLIVPPKEICKTKIYIEFNYL